MSMILSGEFNNLQSTESLSEKLTLIDQKSGIHEFLNSCPKLQKYLEKSSPEEQWVIKSVIALGEGPNVFRGIETVSEEVLRDLVALLLPVEEYYGPIGGIIGYHLMFLELLSGTKEVHDESLHYKQPPGIDISDDNPHVRSAIRWGIEHLNEMAEIYPVGGAGDRLGLLDENTGEPLPAAELRFQGISLLEGLIRDLQAREYVYFKITGKSTITPIALMTSHEKRNATYIQQIFERNHWFGRPKSSFFSFVQPLVPVITEEGHWSTRGALQLSLKPGGHGVIWKLALDSGAFDWLAAKNRSRAIVRQMNNPIAGTDSGLLAFYGLGGSRDKTFGFASCDRRLGAAEGMNVLIEEQRSDGYSYCISNIEYTDFKKHGIPEVPKEPGSIYSQYPANTNILYVNIPEITKLAAKNPVPGLLINLKHLFPFTDGENTREVKGGRVETTMQNISDNVVYNSSEPLQDFDSLKTFLTSNRREKTISVTKSLYDSQKPLNGTPEGAYYTVIENALDLLGNHCQMTVPELCAEDDFIQQGPPFHIYYLPALGPNFSIIGQKIRKGSIAKGSELQLEIAELDLEELLLSGSLQIRADSPLGQKDSEYRNEGGKCTLRNVKVANRGVNWGAEQTLWKNRVSRHESCEIILHGNGEFFAEDLTLEGNQRIEVQDGERVVAEMKNGEIEFRSEKISSPTWYWKYSFDDEDRIRLRIV